MKPDDYAVRPWLPDMPVRDAKTRKALEQILIAGRTPLVGPVGLIGAAGDARGFDVVYRGMRGRWEIRLYEVRKGSLDTGDETVDFRFTNDLEKTVEAGLHWLDHGEVEAVWQRLSMCIIQPSDITRRSGDRRDQ